MRSPSERAWLDGEQAIDTIMGFYVSEARKGNSSVISSDGERVAAVIPIALYDEFQDFLAKKQG